MLQVNSLIQPLRFHTPLEKEFGGRIWENSGPSNPASTMGAADSSLLAHQVPTDHVTIVRARESATSAGPCLLIALQQLAITPPLNIPQPSGISLKDMLLLQSVSDPSTKNYGQVVGMKREDILANSPLRTVPGALDPTTTLHLFELYQQWQAKAATQVCIIQKELGDEIEGVEALEVKLLQRLNFAAAGIKSTAVHLEDVHPLRVEVAQMKRNLHATIQSYNTLCTKIDGLESPLLKEKGKPRRISITGPRSAPMGWNEAGTSQPRSRSSLA